MPLYRPLEEISLADLADAGGKAARLGQAMQLGCPVVPGVVLSTELFRRFMRQGGLHGEIASILSTMQPKTLTQFQAVEWAIRSAFRARRIPEQVSQAIREAWHAAGSRSVVVRSSATNEDSARQSFVGQHATYVDVDSEEAAIDAVLGCWLSLYSAKALPYAQRFGVDLLSSSMAVVLQRKVDIVSEGSLFTQDPITGNPDIFVLEIAEGARRRVVRLDPYERQPGESPFWSRLRHLGLLLDEHLLDYQALEWGIGNDSQLYVLRIRPITGTPDFLPSTARDLGAGRGPLELVSPPDVAARAMRPYSWYHRSRSPRLNAAFFSSIDRRFARYSGRDEFYVCGYLYDRWRRFPGVQIDNGRRGVRRALRALQRLRIARYLDRNFRLLWKQDRPRLEHLASVDLSTLSANSLRRFFEQALELTDQFWQECGRLSGAEAALRGMVRRLGSTWLGAADDLDALLWVSEDQRTAMHEALCELARRRFDDDDARHQAIDQFEQRYRHMFLHGDPLEWWQDVCSLAFDEVALLNELEELGSADGPSLHDQNVRREGQRAALERRLLARLGRLPRAVFQHVLGLARRYTVARIDCQEAARLCRLLERDAVLEVGRRLRAEGLLSIAADACLLGAREQLDWLEGTMQRDELVRLVLERKDMARRWWRYAPPRMLTDDAPSPTLDVGLEANAEDILRGRPVSSGQAQGSARLVSSVTEITNVMPGEVLVCREILFEFTPIFGLVSAIVAERGGLLDQSSTLTREYGIPAVLGIPKLMDKVRTGDELRVDAMSGVIVRKQPEAEWDAI